MSVNSIDVQTMNAILKKFPNKETALKAVSNGTFGLDDKKVDYNQFILELNKPENKEESAKFFGIESANTEPLTDEQKEMKAKAKNIQEQEIAAMKAAATQEKTVTSKPVMKKSKTKIKPAWVRLASKPHSKEAVWYRATQRKLTNFDKEFKNKSVDELVSRLGGFSAKGPLSPEKAAHLREILIRQNPSVFNRNGSIRKDADYKKLDIPNTQWLMEEFSDKPINNNDSPKSKTTIQAKTTSQKTTTTSTKKESNHSQYQNRPSDKPETIKDTETPWGASVKKPKIDNTTIDKAKKAHIKQEDINNGAKMGKAAIGGNQIDKKIMHEHIRNINNISNGNVMEFIKAYDKGNGSKEIDIIQQLARYNTPASKNAALKLLYGASKENKNDPAILYVVQSIEKGPLNWTEYAKTADKILYNTLNEKH